MTLTVDLAPELDSRLQALAEANGMSVAEYVARLVEQAILQKRNEAAITLLSSWLREDAAATPDENRQQQEAWEELKSALNEAHTSDRLLFP